MTFEIKPIPKGKDHPFTLTVNGEKVESPRHMVLSSKYGEVYFGMRPEGFAGWAYREPGGAVTLPFTKTPEGEIMVGLISENRHNMSSKPSWCIPGGILKPGESHDAAQVRETIEETGLNTVEAVPLGLINWNRLYHITSLDIGDGLMTYACAIPFSNLEEKDGHMVLRDDRKIQGVKPEAILTFFPWRQAMKLSGDGMGIATIGLLIAQEL